MDHSSGQERRINDETGKTLLISPMPPDQPDKKTNDITSLSQFTHREIESTQGLLRQTLRTEDRIDVLHPSHGLLSLDDLDYKRVIIGGSLHSVYENLPWIEELKQLVRQFREKRVPLLGICFGHQLIAEALGGKVEKTPVEFGVKTLKLTSKGCKDPLFDGMGDDLLFPEKRFFPVIQTHGDTVTQLPQDDIDILAETEKYSNQALAIGPRIRTVQFHPEMDRSQLAYLAMMMRERLEKELFQDDPMNGFLTLIKTLIQEEEDEVPIQNYGHQVIRNFYRMTV